MMKLSEFEPGDHGVVTSIGDAQLLPAMKRKLLSMGITPNVRVQFVRRAPLGSGMEIIVRGARLCMRRELADAIGVVKLLA